MTTSPAAERHVLDHDSFGDRPNSFCLLKDSRPPPVHRNIIGLGMSRLKGVDGNADRVRRSPDCRARKDRIAPAEDNKPTSMGHLVGPLTGMETGPLVGLGGLALLWGLPHQAAKLHRRMTARRQMPDEHVG